MDGHFYYYSEWMAISSVGSLTAVGWFTTLFEWMAIPSGWLFRVDGYSEWMVFMDGMLFCLCCRAFSACTFGAVCQALVVEKNG